MDAQKTLLAVALSFLVLLFFQTLTPPPPKQEKVESAETATGESTPATAPNTGQSTQPQATATTTALPTPAAQSTLATGKILQLETPLYSFGLNSATGDIQSLALKKYPVSANDKTPIQLLDFAPNAFLVQQSGVFPLAAPLHLSMAPGPLTLHEKDEDLTVTFHGESPPLRVTRTLRLRPDSYLIEQTIRIENHGSTPWIGQAFSRLVGQGESHGSMFMPTYSGPVMLKEGSLDKIATDDLSKRPLRLPAENGWSGYMSHYFLSAVLPAASIEGELYAEKIAENRVGSGVLYALPPIASGAALEYKEEFFLGPKEQQLLEKTGHGLERAVDYGWFTILCRPLFWLLSLFHDLTHNWGLAIILLTIAVKLAFYPLASASYRSMASMKKVHPKMMQLRERYGDDQRKLGEEMMKLYSEEKVNPFSGCLPMVVQIPFFIALYYVLLESIEIRQAPFVLWIADLSAPDPFFVLPLLMGVTMFLQQKLNPQPADPVQAKVLMVLPVVFTVFFVFFPAGLVLYWVVNNVFSILQQWWIMRQAEGPTEPKK